MADSRFAPIGEYISIISVLLCKGESGAGNLGSIPQSQSWRIGDSFENADRKFSAFSADDKSAIVATALSSLVTFLEKASERLLGISRDDFSAGRFLVFNFKR